LDSKSLNTHLIKLNLAFDNFKNWQKKLKAVLTLLDSSDLIENDGDGDAKIKDKDWLDKDEQILKLIYEYIDVGLRHYLSNCKTSLEAWSSLQVAYEEFSNRKQDHELVNALESYVIDTSNDESVVIFERMCHQIVTSKIVIGDARYRAIKFINSAPDKLKEELINETDYEKIKLRLTKEDECTSTAVEDHQNDQVVMKDEKTDSTYDEPPLYRDNAFIIDSSKLNDEKGKSPNANGNVQVIKDIRFMKPEDLELSLKQTVSSPNSGNKKDRSDRNNRKGNTRKTMFEENNKNESLFKPVNPYSVNGYASMDLFQMLQKSDSIKSCYEILNSNLIRKPEKDFNYNSN